MEKSIYNVQKQFKTSPVSFSKERWVFLFSCFGFRCFFS